MPAQSKYEMLEKINGSIDASKGMFVVDYRGLTVKETQEFRRSLRAVGAEMKVYKNNIVKIALKEKNLPALDDMLEGTCAYVFFKNDPVDAAKTIKTSTEKLKKIQFVGGIADGKALSADQAKAYADLPSHDELIAQLLHVLVAPLSGIANVCAGSARGLVTTLKAIEDQKNAA